MARTRRIVGTGGRCIPLAIAMLVAVPAPASASPCLVVAMTADAKDRSALLADLSHEQVTALRRWQIRGTISSYRMMFTRAPDAGVWDAMMVLLFPDEAAETRWRRDAPLLNAGVVAGALAHVRSIETTPCEEVRREGPAGRPSGPTLVVPYRAQISPTDYLAYLDGYTIPQFHGWMKDNVLAGFEIVTSRYPAGREWNALILLNYRDDASLARREQETAKVRADLTSDAGWRAYSESKKNIRTEGRLAVADDVLR